MAVPGPLMYARRRVRPVSISRRKILSGFLAAAALASCRGRRPASRAAGPDRPLPPRPRHLVLIAMRGGLDAVLSTSPKRPGEVDASVDVPYAPGDVFEVNGHRYGPHLRPLAPHLGSFAIVNNVHVGTVQHETGEPQLVRLRTRVGTAVPTAADVIGWYREGPPLGAIALGGRLWDASSAGMLDCTARRILSGEDRDLCDALLALPPDELHRSAEALDHLAAGAHLAAGSGGAPETRRHAGDMAALLRRIAAVPPFREETWVPETEPGERMFFNAPRIRFIARDLQRTLWLLEHELVACVNVGCRELEWDSHVHNLVWQTRMNAAYFPVLARFLEELHRRRNRHGTLAEQTMIVMGSELGRHPRLNDHGGKDHFPETSLFLAGPNVRTAGRLGAVYGATGRRMEGLPISPATGMPDRSGYVPTLDDVGATVMAAFGIDPLAHGYTGRHLPFLVDV